MKLAGPSYEYATELPSCALCPYGGPRVGSRGNPQAKVVFIGEAPGAQELTHGIPLVGPSGEVFWRTLPPDAPLDDILILNACQCLPPRSKDTAKNTAAVARGAQACHARLMMQVEEFPRSLIVAMGNHALRSLTLNNSWKITQIRGQLLQYAGSAIGLLPILHPAALLRGTGNYRQFREDILYAFDLLRGIPRRSPVTPRYFVARHKYHVAQICNSLISKTYIALDTETGGFNHLTDEILAVGLCADADLVYIVPGDLTRYLKPLFSNGDLSGPKFIWHNGKFDMRFMRRPDAVGEAARCDEDTMLLSYTLDEQGGIHDLEQVGNDLIGAPDYKHMLKPYLPNKKTSYRAIPKPILYRYLALDTSNTRQIFDVLRPRVSSDAKLEKCYTRVLMAASEFLYRVEQQGIMVCPNRVKHQAKVLQQGIDDSNSRLQNAAVKAGSNVEINPNSPQQLAVLLFDRLRLKSPKAGERSTAKGILEKLPKHPVVEAISDYRKAKKAKSTYVDSLVKNVNIDGRVHATYLIHGTRSGRLSSRGPNMQNIPRGTAIRSMYMAAPHHVFIKADLNQAELRSLAVLSGDDYLLEVYAPGSKRKLHWETAADFYPGWERLDPKQGVGLDQLMRAKAVNFGIVYGRQAPSLAAEFSIPVLEAQRWINKWRDRSPKAWDFIEKCRQAPIQGYNLVTLFGRKKRHWLVTQENLIGLQNEAANFPHQSIAHDICLLGGAKAEPILRPFGVHPVNEVHDEIMFECPDIPELIAYAKYVIIRCMESIAPEWGLTRIPFIAEADVGRRWNIYRNPKLKEFRYEYSPDDSDRWWEPNSSVRAAYLQTETDPNTHKDSSILGSKQGMETSRVLWDKTGLGYEPDTDGTDGDESDLQQGLVWGPPPSSQPDHRDYE